MYSLLSSAVLAGDLARHPHGSRVADALDRVLALTQGESAALGAPADEVVRRRVLAACGAPRVSTALTDAAGVVAPDGLAGLATRLEAGLLGTLEDLHAMVLREEPVAGLAPQAQQVVLDGLTVAWAGSGARLHDLQVLAGPWERALDPLPPALPERPWTSGLRAVLDEVPRRGLAQWRAVVRAHRSAPRSRWSTAMHTTSEAAWRAGRLHDLGRAQLAAARVLCLSHSGVAPGPAAMAVTAAVQAVCTADLVDEPVTRALLADWEAGSAAR